MVDFNATYYEPRGTKRVELIGITVFGVVITLYNRNFHQPLGRRLVPVGRQGCTLSSSRTWIITCSFLAFSGQGRHSITEPPFPLFQIYFLPTTSYCSKLNCKENHLYCDSRTWIIPCCFPGKAAIPGVSKVGPHNSVELWVQWNDPFPFKYL